MNERDGMKRILLVEDDEGIAELLLFYLQKKSAYQVKWVTTACDALLSMTQTPDLILLDICLPDIDGVALCRKLRDVSYCPILFISCLDDEETIVKALEVGGDDYLIKPFSEKILMSRIEANLRRVDLERSNYEAVKLYYPDFVIDTVEHAIIQGEKKHPLPPIEFSILMYFVAHPQRSISLDELYENIWGKPCFGDVRTVITHVYNIRRIIESDKNSPSYIRNIRGYGYRFYPKGDGNL